MRNVARMGRGHAKTFPSQQGIILRPECYVYTPISITCYEWEYLIHVPHLHKMGIRYVSGAPHGSTHHPYDIAPPCNPIASRHKWPERNSTPNIHFSLAHFHTLPSFNMSLLRTLQPTRYALRGLSTSAIQRKTVMDTVKETADAVSRLLPDTVKSFLESDDR